MLRKILLAAILTTPLVTFAQSQSAYEHANSHASFKHAPEIDGANAALGLALLGGILSLVVRKNKKDRKDD